MVAHCFSATIFQLMESQAHALVLHLKYVILMDAVQVQCLEYAVRDKDHQLMAAPDGSEAQGLRQRQRRNVSGPVEPKRLAASHEKSEPLHNEVCLAARCLGWDRRPAGCLNRFLAAVGDPAPEPYPISPARSPGLVVSR